MTAVALVVLGYLAGSLPFGYWLVRLGRGVDIRKLASGNIGASNVFRNFGPAYGVPVAVLDVAKGFAPAFAATAVAGTVTGALAGAAAMVGHWRPLFLGFARGGKMVATAAGAFLGVAPLVVAVAAAVWIAVLLLGRYVSVASILAALSAPVAAIVLGEPVAVVGLAVVAALGVVVLHRPNIARLRAGTENRFRFRRARGGRESAAEA